MEELNNRKVSVSYPDSLCERKTNIIFAVVALLQGLVISPFTPQACPWPIKEYIHVLWRQGGRVVKAPDLKCGGPGFKSRSEH